MTGELATAKGGALDAPRKPPTMAVEFTDEPALNIEVRGDYDRIERATAHPEVKAGLLSHLALLGAPGAGQVVCKSTVNFALGFVDSMEPSDPAEALLCAQMAAIHQATMAMARRLNHARTPQQQDAAERALNKLARTYAAQMEALKRYRSKGQQVVRVERVTVESGAQAVVGHVSHGGGGQ